MSTLNEAKMPNLKQKIEAKAVLEKEIVKLDDEIDELVGEKKVKIKRVSLKGSKNPKAKK
jgi:hypothetical protein